MVRPAPPASARAGFTMIESIVALTISSALVLMVGAVFLVQNEFFAWILLRSQVQENARSITELVGSEIRSVAPNGVILADSSRMAIHSPIVSALACGTESTDSYVHIPGGLASVDQGDVAALGVLDAGTGQWTFYDATWSQLVATGGTPAATCEGNGADTVDVSSEFLRLKVGTVIGGAAPAIGTVLMLCRKTEFKFADSVLDPNVRAIFRGAYGETLVELATGLNADAHFEYRFGTTTHYKVVSGDNLPLVDGLRIVAESVGQGDSGARPEFAFGWTVDVPLTNVR